MLQHCTRYVDISSTLKACEASSTVDFADTVLILIKEQVYASNIQFKGSSAMQGKFCYLWLQRIGLAFAASRDVGFEATVCAASQHGAQHLAANDPYPQILAGTAADGGVQNTRFASGSAIKLPARLSLCRLCHGSSTR